MPGSGRGDAGGDHPGVMSGGAQGRCKTEHVILHASGPIEVVGADEGDAHQSFSKKGCMTCQSAGCRRIRATKKSAIC